MNTYAERIRAARIGQDMNDLAQEIATDRTVDQPERDRLQIAFEVRMRELWPRSFRGGA